MYTSSRMILLHVIHSGLSFTFYDKLLSLEFKKESESIGMTTGFISI